MQFAKYQDTVENKVNKLKTAWEELRLSFINSEGIKTVLDWLIKLLDKLNEFSGFDFAALGVTWLTFGKVAIKNLISGFQSGASALQKSFGKLTDKLFTGGNNSSNVIRIRTNISEAQANIARLKEEIRRLSDEKAKIDVNTDDAERKIQELDEKIEESQIGILTNERTEEESEQELEDAQTRGQKIGAVLATSITTAVTAVMAENNPGKAAGMVIFTGITSILPDFIKAVKTGFAAAGSGGLKAFITSTGGIGAIIVAITAALTALAVVAKKAFDNFQAEKVANQIEDLKNQIDDLNDKIQDTQSKLSETSDELNNLENIKDTYNELKNKIVLTEEEQEKYNSLVETLQTNYPELISYYDEETGQLRIQNELLNEKIEKITQLKKTEAAQLLGQQNQSIILNNQKGVLEKMSKLGSDMSLSSKADSVASAGFEHSDVDEFNSSVQELVTSTDELTAQVHTVVRDTGQSYTSSRRILLSRGNTQFDIDETSALKFYNENLLGEYQNELESLSDEQMETVANVYAYAFTQDKKYLKGLFDNEKLAAEGLYDLVETAKSGIEEINDDFIDLYSNIKSYYDEIFPDMSESEKEIRSSYAAGINDIIDNLQLSDETTIKGSSKSFSGAMSNLVNDINQRIPDTLKNNMDLDIEGLSEDFNKIYEVIAEGAWGAENHFADVYSALNAQQRQLLEKMGITAETYETYFSAGQSDEATAQWLYQAFYTQVYSAITDAIGNMDESTFSEMININENLNANSGEMTFGKYNEERKKLIEMYTELLGDSERAESMVSQLFPIEDIENAIKQLESLNISTNNFSINTVEALSSASANIQSYFGDSFANEAKDSIQSYIDYIQNSNLPSDIQNALFSFDPTSLEGSTKQDAINTITELVSNPALENALGEQEAQAFAEGYINELETGALADFSITSVVGFENVSDEIESSANDIVEKFSDITGYITSQISQGFIDATDKVDLGEKLSEMGLNIDDYIEIDDNGNFSLLYEKLYEDSQGLLDNQDELIEAAKEEYRQGLEQLKIQKNSLETILNQTQGTISLTKAVYSTNKAYAQQQAILAGISTEQYLTNIGVEINDSGIINIEQITSEQMSSINEQISGLDDTIEEMENNLKDPDFWKNAANVQAFSNQLASLYNNAVSDGLESAKEEADKLADSLEKVNEAQEKVIEAQNELNEALYGEKYHKNALDFMYNYETALEAVQRTADKAKEALDDLSTDDDIGKNLQDYQNAIHQEAVLLKAESAEYQQAIDNYESVIKNRLKEKLEEINAMDPSFNVNTDIADYLYQGEDGMYYINYDALNLANIPDDFSDFLEESADQMNEWTKAILDNEDKLAEREKEIEEMHEQAIDSRVSLEDKVQEILKEKYEEEISDVEEKYSAMEEANDEYLDALEDALQKERDLRERSNQWEELAQKEKKLSLMQRDTSGANQTDVLELQNEIQEDREQLLDDTVDDILETLKEQYELQKEAHEQEIEFMNTITEDSNLSAMAAEVINSWPSYEAALDWFYQNDQEFANASDAKREQLTNEWIELYNNSKMYDQMNYDEMKNALNTTDQEIQLKMDEITETATTEGERILNETSDKVNQEISDAKDALAQALEDLADAQKEYAEAVSEGLKYSALSNGNGNNSNSSQINSGNTKAYNTRLEAETAARTLAQAGNTGITIDEKDGKYYVNYTKKFNAANAGKTNLTMQDAVNGNATAADIVAANKKMITKTSSNTSTTFADEIKNLIPEGRYGNGRDINNSPTDDDYKFKLLIKNSEGVGTNLFFKDENTMDTVMENINLQFGKEVTMEKFQKKGIGLFGMMGNKWSSYASGGLVDYTGPAWVDGTKSKPEAFLSSDDTRRIGEAAELLSKLPILNSTSTSETQMASSIGDTSIEIHINIDKIESDYDVDDMIERVRQDIVDVANPTGTVQILRK